MTKRIMISVNENDYASIKKYCDSHGYSVSGFMAQTATDKVKSYECINIMQTMLNAMSRLDADSAEKQSLSEALDALTVLMGGDMNG